MVFYSNSGTENPDDAKKFCSNCGEQIDARAEICPHCGVRVAMPPSTKNPTIAVILSFFIIGLGQVYNGKYAKAIIMFVLAVISAMLWGVGIGVITSLIIWIWSMSDAWNVAKGTGGSTSGSVTTAFTVVGGFVLILLLLVVISAVIGAFVFGMGGTDDGTTNVATRQENPNTGAELITKSPDSMLLTIDDMPLGWTGSKGNFKYIQSGDYRSVKSEITKYTSIDEAKAAYQDLVPENTATTKINFGDEGVGYTTVAGMQTRIVFRKANVVVKIIGFSEYHAMDMADIKTLAMAVEKKM